MNTFCTIITADYLFYALALNESLVNFNPEISFQVLIADENDDWSNLEKEHPNMSFFDTSAVCKEGLGKEIYQKYFVEEKNMDHFRWSMKSVFMKYLLDKMDFDKVLFVDPDIFFFNDYEFLFDELSESSIILTPHWRSIHPERDKWNFPHLFTNGLFNAGFIGANRAGIEALIQWSKWCLYKCVKDESKGMFVDQTYLNLLPIYFDKVKIIKHRGCNVADWNRTECIRIKKGDQVLIDNKYEIIFIHFVLNSIMGALYGKDQLLKPHVLAYFEILQKYNPHFNPKEKYIAPIPFEQTLKGKFIIFISGLLPIGLKNVINKLFFEK